MTMPSRTTPDPRSGVYAPRDFISASALIIGFRDWAYRRQAVNALHLARGDRVVEIGCGTGRNFPLLIRAVGPEGAVIGVDISDAVLVRARRRVVRENWSNVELVLSDAATYEFPDCTDAVLSTYTLAVVPEYDRVLAAAFQALKVGGRCAVLDQRLPTGLASRLVPLLDFLSRPLPYSSVLRERRIWESVSRHSGNVRVEELYYGFVFLAVGEKTAADRGHQGSDCQGF